MSSCTDEQDPEVFTYLNTSHLEHLYEEVVIDGDTLGAVWIYCDAPDYQVVTDDDEGFTCVDDVARALVFYCRVNEQRNRSAYEQKIKQMTSFLFHMQSYSHYFYNFMFPNEEINTLHPNSVAGKNFWSWRACWALTEVCGTTDAELSGIRADAEAALEDLIPKIISLSEENSGYEYHEGIRIPALAAQYGGDQLALMAIVLSNYYEITHDAQVLQGIENIGEVLLETQITDTIAEQHAFLSWKNIWHAWGNSQSYALLLAGEAAGRDDFTHAALQEINNFFPYALEQKLSGFSVRKEDNVMLTENISSYPRIAYALRPMVFAAVKAWEITGEEHYAAIAAEAGSWFLGNNSAGAAMYDSISGRCYDGIDGAQTINFNAGAESTIEALLSIQCIEQASLPFQKLQEYSIQ